MQLRAINNIFITLRILHHKWPESKKIDVVSRPRSAVVNTLDFLQVIQDLPHPQKAVPLNPQSPFRRVYAFCEKAQAMYRPYSLERVYTHVGLKNQPQ